MDKLLYLFPVLILGLGVIAVDRARRIGKRLNAPWLQHMILALFLTTAALLINVISIRERGPSLTDRVQTAYQSMLEASKLVEALQKELTLKLEELEKLRTTYETYSQLATIEESKASALIRQLEASLGRSRRWDWVQSLALNLLAGAVVFILGARYGHRIDARLGPPAPPGDAPPTAN